MKVPYVTWLGRPYLDACNSFNVKIAVSSALRLVRESRTDGNAHELITAVYVISFGRASLFPARYNLSIRRKTRSAFWPFSLCLLFEMAFITVLYEKSLGLTWTFPALYSCHIWFRYFSALYPQQRVPDLAHAFSTALKVNMFGDTTPSPAKKLSCISCKSASALRAPYVPSPLFAQQSMTVL